MMDFTLFCVNGPTGRLQKTIMWKNVLVWLEGKDLEEGILHSFEGTIRHLCRNTKQNHDHCSQDIRYKTAEI